MLEVKRYLPMWIFFFCNMFHRRGDSFGDYGGQMKLLMYVPLVIAAVPPSL